MTIIGVLASKNEFSLLPTQKDAWLLQIAFLQQNLKGLSGSIFFEYTIPRMGKRIDTVLIIGPAVFVLEFKVGESEYHSFAVDQVWDYALDLKNFHEESHSAALFPMLIATESQEDHLALCEPSPDYVFQPLLISPSSFRPTINRALANIGTKIVDANLWYQSSYRPTPTIIEAARALYAKHSVEEIARSDAGAQNLALTSDRVLQIVTDARVQKKKVICFITGVPGAGKTLVGLNIATRNQRDHNSDHAVFLSGNAPLVAVLREALTRDEVFRQKLRGERVRKSDISSSIKAFIQNVHHFRDSAISDPKPPFEKVVIFDEAQRAWNLRQTASFMLRKKGHANFAMSEPEFLISCMDRHQEWAAIICLVGGGQEINQGEAGITAWIQAATTKFPDWDLHISPNLIDKEYSEGKVSEHIQDRTNRYFDPSLHLAVSMRSFRSDTVSAFVKALLDCEIASARNLFEGLQNRYPIVVTRSLEKAKQWIKKNARGSERFGLVASSKAMRLKPHAIDIRVEIDPVKWFLNGKNDIRSSYFLEDAATEFQVQGLELDWTCVTWDGDLRRTGNGWSFHDFRGSRWCQVANADNQRYLVNAYRVLLTRARQGMVLFIPPGDHEDSTRNPSYYDSTYNYLQSIGIPVLI